MRTAQDAMRMPLLETGKARGVGEVREIDCMTGDRRKMREAQGKESIQRGLENVSLERE
jgi:hypothetical protein